MNNRHSFVHRQLPNPIIQNRNDGLLVPHILPSKSTIYAETSSCAFGISDPSNTIEEKPAIIHKGGTPTINRNASRPRKGPSALSVQSSAAAFLALQFQPPLADLLEAGRRCCRR